MRFLCWIILLFCNTLLAQNVYFENVTTLSGLSNNSIDCIENDAQGNLWIGTWDGLNIYDGKKVTVYKNRINDTSTLGGNRVLSIKRDGQDVMWLSTDSKKVGQYVGQGKFKNYVFPDFPLGLSVNSKGDLIVELKDGTYYVFKDNKFVSTSVDISLYSKSKFELPEIKRQQLVEKFASLGIKSNINYILKDKKDTFWVATQSEGLFLIAFTISGDLDVLEHYTLDAYNPFGLLANEITVLHRDTHNNVWLGLKDGGVARLLDKNKSIGLVTPHYKEQPYMPNQTIRAITKDYNQQYWLGYYTQGLFVKPVSSEFFEPYILKKATENKEWNRIRSLFTDSYGDVWVGTYAGVVRIEGQSQHYYTEESTPFFEKNRTYSFVEDKNMLWTGGWGGISKFNLKTKKFETFLNQSVLRKYHVRNLSFSEGTLYIATEEHGLILFDTNSGDIQVFNQESGLVGNSVYDVYIDGISGETWVACLGGISVFNKNKNSITNIREDQGLPSHLVYSLEGVDNSVWISTTKGIASINKKTQRVTDYSNYIGWQGLEFAEGAHFKDNNGTLVYGGNHGVNFFNPIKLIQSQSSPIFKLLLNKEVMMNIGVIALNSTQNNLEIELYAAGFTKFARNQFEYRILGLFEDWRVLPDSFFLLDNLAFKSYTIQIRDSTNTAFPIVFEQEFEIEKPLYLTPFFIVLVALIITIGVLVYIKQKQRQIKKQEREFQGIIECRTKEIRLQKESLLNQNEKLKFLNEEITIQKNELFTLHSRAKTEDIEMERFRVFLLYRIKKPLTKILEYTQYLESNTELKKEVYGLYDMVREWNMLEQIKDFDTNSTQSIEIKVFIDRLIVQFSYLPTRFNVQIEFVNQLIERCVVVDVLRLKMIIQYLVNECCKFADLGHLITITFLNRNEQVVIQLKSESDNLKLYWMDNHKFSPYYRAVKVLIEDLGGSVDNKIDSQFLVELSIPVIQCLDLASANTTRLEWKSLLDDLKVLTNDKINLLVYSNENDVDIVNQVFTEFPRCNMIYTPDVNDCLRHIQHYNFDALIIYSVRALEQLRILLMQAKNAITKQRLLIFYIAEEVDYILQEQLFQIGISDLIHLPLSTNLIDSKILKRIESDRINRNSNNQLVEKFTNNHESVVRVSSDEKLIRKAISIIEEHLGSTEFGVEELALLLNISKMKCYRLFKEFLDKSPLEILIDMRMKKAELLLQNSTLRIAEISFECGYNDPKHFSKTFKKYFSISPSEYQKQ